MSQLRLGRGRSRQVMQLVNSRARLYTAQSDSRPGPRHRPLWLPEALLSTVMALHLHKTLPRTQLWQHSLLFSVPPAWGLTLLPTLPNHSPQPKWNILHLSPPPQKPGKSHLKGKVQREETGKQTKLLVLLFLIKQMGKKLGKKKNSPRVSHQSMSNSNQSGLWDPRWHTNNWNPKVIL